MGTQRADAQIENYSKLDETIELVKRLCLAQSTGRIYGADHPNAVDAVRAAYVWLNRVLELSGEVSISFAENQLLVDGMPIEERNPVVAKFAKGFQQLHVDNLVFTPALSFEEFLVFFQLLGRGPKMINSQGGMPALIAEKKLTNVQIKQISYVMVREDEKVVKRDDQVVSSKLLGVLASDQQLVNYMVHEILKRAEERQWLITETKNNPMRVAQLITEGIELAVSRSEAGLDPAKSIEGLIENIKLVGKNIVEDKPGVTGDAELEEAIVTMENELRVRSKKLMSTETAVGFVNEILAVVTSYSDQIKAKRISDEILKGQRNLKSTERLIKKLAPKGQASEEYLARIRDLLLARGITEEQLLRLVRSIRAARRQQRKPPAPPQPIVEHIARELEAPVADAAQRQQVATNLAGLFNRELSQRARHIELQFSQLQSEVNFIGQILDQAGLGLVTWTTAGQVNFINRAAAERLALAQGHQLGAALLDGWNQWQFPLSAMPAGTTDWPAADARLLMAVERPVQDAKGQFHGAILRANVAGS
jgi:hypothetical protein